MQHSRLTANYIIPIFSLVVLSGCTEADVFHQGNRTLKSQLTLIGPSAQPIVKNDDGTICYGPQPDATIDETVAGSNSAFGIGAADEELPLGGRNPNVLITRDILFQSCLAESRMRLTKAERMKLYYKTLDTIQAINSATLEGAYITNDNSNQSIAVPAAPPLRGQSAAASESNF